MSADKRTAAEIAASIRGGVASDDGAVARAILATMSTPRRIIAERKAREAGVSVEEFVLSTSEGSNRARARRIRG
ncbi:hypothetical protein [Knoellia koreensis]|uniref:Uncharacterized protein n=1 Tax=Knoellia koreensis TaxID=2730921 RepID=A0A849H9B6_9MICO|nr:hypothetical protein [Knoellia sp. DB2414S]NNM44525.1 hypothetical protein [Knoellia sp. DB2414S]